MQVVRVVRVAKTWRDLSLPVQNQSVRQVGYFRHMGYFVTKESYIAKKLILGGEILSLITVLKKIYRSYHPFVLNCTPSKTMFSSLTIAASPSAQVQIGQHHAATDPIRFSEMPFAAANRLRCCRSCLQKSSLACSPLADQWRLRLGGNFSFSFSFRFGHASCHTHELHDVGATRTK